MSRCRTIVTGLAAVVVALGARPVAGQTITGRITSSGDGSAVRGAVVHVISVGSGPALATAISDSSGRFTLALPSTVPPSRLIIRQIGFRPDTVALPGSGTRGVEVRLVPLPQVLPQVAVTESADANVRALGEAVRRGWRVYTADLIDPHRARAGSLSMLVRLVGVIGVVPPRSPTDCLRSMRNQMCLAVVVDGIVTSPLNYVNPNDVDFFAVIGPSESRLQFGERAPYGAIVVYTRNGNDGGGSWLSRRP